MDEGKFRLQSSVHPQMLGESAWSWLEEGEKINWSVMLSRAAPDHPAPQYGQLASAHWLVMLLHGHLQCQRAYGVHPLRFACCGACCLDEPLLPHCCMRSACQPASKQSSMQHARVTFGRMGRPAHFPCWAVQLSAACCASPRSGLLQQTGAGAL